ncbi:MAG TPA: hypothetical protein VNI52_00840 [Sphingobacteriaceae bacterium]|nr:hypothetical protein [Sphingobacteriaceae bacterium]
MSIVAEQLNNVVNKTARLIDLCVALQEENDLLKLENLAMKTVVESSRTKIQEQEEKFKVIKVARSLEDVSEKNLDIKQKISEFVREIDKCIVLLKK